MMSKNDERKIIDSLANDDMLEMNADDLEQMLNDELSKPESEIDGQLVKEILDVLEPGEPDPAQMQASWLHVKENLPKRRGRSGWQAGAARFAAAAAVIAIVLVSTMEDAGAFRWTLLKKILKPVAETFGIVMDDRSEVNPEQLESTVYSVSDAPSELVTYAALDEVPEMHDIYRIRPHWLPEGFSFAAGSRFTSCESDIYSLDFSDGTAQFNMTVHIISNEDTVYAREFERTLKVPIELSIGQHVVTFYNNADDIIQSALWIVENSNYLISGELSVENITRFIEHME